MLPVKSCGGTALCWLKIKLFRSRLRPPTLLITFHQSLLSTRVENLFHFGGSLQITPSAVKVLQGAYCEHKLSSPCILGLHIKMHSLCLFAVRSRLFGGAALCWLEIKLQALFFSFHSADDFSLLRKDMCIHRPILTQSYINTAHNILNKSITYVS